VKKFKCKNHPIEVQIPITEEEYLSGKFHQDIEKCHSHYEIFQDCVFEEVMSNEN